MTNEEVAQIVENEGLGYAIQHYMDSSEFEDRELAAMWDEADTLLNKITEKLDQYTE